jgi:hypothetical protein
MSNKHHAPGAGGAMSGRAMKTIEGEQQAAQYLARLQAQQADPDELAVLVSMLYGEMLRGFCSAIEKAIRGRHD